LLIMRLMLRAAITLYISAANTTAARQEAAPGVKA